ncbi:Glucosidase II subunit alpha [Entamoeba marina]
MLVVHNILNYGLGNKAALANKFRGKLSDYKHDSTVPLNLKSFNCHEYSTPYQCNKGLLQLIQLNFSSYRNDNNYDENHINDILLKLPQLHPNVNNIIICLNNIDTPYLKDNHKLFLRKLPQIIPFCTNSRFILNTNSIDGTFLFTLSELIHMRMIINRCKGEQWTSSTKWFSPYKVKELNQKKRSRKDRLFESFRMLVMKQKQICLVLSDSEGLSFPFLLDECRKRDILTTHSELTSHLKKLQERSLIDLGARGYQLKIDPSSATHLKCEDTAFCRRARDGKQHFSASNKLLSKTSSSVLLDVHNTNEKSHFHLEVTALLNGIFRLHMTHVDGGKVYERYEPDVGIVLTENGLKGAPLQVKDNGKTLELVNDKSKLVITYATLEMKMYVDNIEVLSINEDSSLRFEVGLDNINGVEVDGAGPEVFKTWTDSKPNGPAGVSLGYKFLTARQFAGIPSHATSLALKSTDKKGYDEPYRLYNTDVHEFEVDNEMTLYGSVPVIYGFSNQGAGVFHNNPTETFVDVFDKTIRFVSESGVIDDFLLPGPTPKDLVQQYLHLTGVSPLPPKYTLAYHQCRWNYMTQDEAEEVIDKMDEAKIPFDVLWLDIEHTVDKKYFTWNENKFPDPLGLQNRLKSTERRMVTIVDPHIKKLSSYYVYKEGDSKDFFIKDKNEKRYEGWCWSGNSVYIDFINPKAREWWGTLFGFDKYQYSTPYLQIWNDMNEPSVFNGPEITMQKDNIHTDGIHKYEHRDVHNIYGMTYQMSSYNGLMKRGENQERSFVLSRSFFAGTQKFGAVWTGDTDSTWDHLKESIIMTLNLNLVGIIQSGGDVGGFFRDPSEELTVRWYQVGTFYPFFRAHAHIEAKRREPYLFKGETRKQLVDAIEMKYLLMEYWYREYYLAVANKSPLIKPLWFDYPNDEQTDLLEAEFLAGNDLLVTGVCEQGAKSVSVYIPNGIWYDFYTNTVIDNGLHNIQVTMDNIPLYVRGGAVLPLKERQRRSSQLMNNDPYTIVLYANGSKKAEGIVYVDDGLTTKQNNLISTISLDKNGISNIANKNGEDVTVNTDIIKFVVIGLNKPNTIYSGNNKLQFDQYRTTELNGKGFVIRKPMVSLKENWRIAFNYREEL